MALGGTAGGAGAPPRAMRRRLARLVAGCSLVGAVAASADALTVTAASTFTVDATGDGSDTNPGDGVCRTSGGTCTLRAAVEESEARPGRDTIRFAVPGTGPHRIRLRSPLDRIEDPSGVTIDGYSQPGSQANTLDHGSNAVLMIEVRGGGAGNFDGFDFRSGGNVLSGLALFDFARHVRLYGPNARGNSIVGNFIGTDASGTFRAPSRVPSGSDGVHVQEGASGNSIGGPTRADRNVISGSADRGIGIYDPGSDRNVVRNNVIGLTPAGDAPLPNRSHGIDINTGASDNVVGGPGPLDGNVISGNELSGVEVSHNEYVDGVLVATTTGNRVVGNLIGTDATGTVSTPDLANGEYGVGLEGEAFCSVPCRPDISDQHVIGNVIVGGEAAVAIYKGAYGNVVEGNRLGELADGVTASNTDIGVLIYGGAFDNLVRHNRIARVRIGISVREFAGPVATPTYGNTFTGNSIEHVAQLGIDLAPEGPPTASPDPLVMQEGVPMPSVVAVTTDAVTVSGCDGCVVEVYETPDLPNAGHGVGRRSIGAATVSSGVAVVTLRTTPADPWVVRAGEFVTATITTPGGSTSEFSLRATVSAGTLGPPPATTTTTTVPTPPPGPGAGPESGSAQRTAVRCALSASC